MISTSTRKLLRRSLMAMWTAQSPYFRTFGSLKSLGVKEPMGEIDFSFKGWKFTSINVNKKQYLTSRWSTFPTMQQGGPFTVYGALKMSCDTVSKKLLSTYQSQTVDLGGIIEIPLAQTGEGIADCELLTWFVNEGDEVEQFQPLCDVQSDKATVQITSRYKGKVSRLNFIPGDVVKVGETLLEIIAGESSFKVGSIDLSASTESHESHTSNTDIETSGKKVLATPVVRHMAEEYGLNLNCILGTGKDGRILKDDVLKHVANKEGLNEDLSLLIEMAPKLDSDTSTDETVDKSGCLPPFQGKLDGLVSEPRILEGTIPEDRIIHVRGYQRIMAKTMTAAAAIPHLYIMEELNMDAFVNLRKILQDSFMKERLKLTFLPFIIKALSVAMKKYPLVNSTCNENASELCCRGVHNIGVAIATSHGLVVPNIKNVQQLSLLEIAEKLSHLTELALTHNLNSEDVKDGTITVSNFGTIGGKFGSPMLNLPEVAILALGRIQKLPRFSDDGSIYPASIMSVTWGADHRVLDGATVARACGEWKGLIEQPERLLVHLR